MRIKTTLALLVTALAAAGPGLGQDLYIKGARVVDPRAREVRSENLLIENGRIRGRPAEAPPDFEGRVVDATGRWLIPGLNDLHVHSYGNMAPGQVFDSPGTAAIAERVLAAGVTGFLDLFGSEQALHALRERQRAGEAGGATVFASLSCLTAPEGHCTEYGVPTRTMSTAEEARAVVADLAKKKPDVVKIVYAPAGRMPSIDRTTLTAAVATASELGIKTVIHVQSWKGVADAVAAGASAVTHVPDQEPVPARLAAAMAEKGVHLIPTLAVETDFRHFVGSSELLEEPLLRALAPAAVVAAYRDYEPSERARRHAAGAEEREARIFASVKRLADAGVTVLAGTDAGNYGTVHGFSLHRELEKLVAAGLSPWQALAAATSEAGAFLGRSFGVDDGDEANLVLLAASPIEDIRNTRRIAGVIFQGRPVELDEIEVVPAPSR